MQFTEIFKPKSFDDILGQNHLFDNNSLFRKIIENTDFESIILTGPPGTGKTTIAELVGDYLSIPFHRLNAASSGNSDIKNIMETTRHYGKPTVIFIDEIHRFSKIQQDLLLQLIDGKHGLLIGASTENPYYNLTPALRSRSLLFKLERIENNEFYKILDKIKSYLKEKYEVDNVIIEEKEFEKIVESSNGDFRKFLNIMEISSLMAEKKGSSLYLSFPKNDVFTTSYSKQEHYDLLSALIKSIRGSDPDAAVIWCFKLLKSGVSAEEIFRRLVISASEDIGNAYPDAIVFINAAYSAFEKTGMPEGKIILSHAVCYLASCPKSNRVYKAFKKVDKFLSNNNPMPPNNITQQNIDYKYPFDFGEFILQDYSNVDEMFYEPSDIGFESKFKNRLKRLWKNKKKYD